MFRTGAPQDVMRCDGTYFGFPDPGEAPMASAFLHLNLQVACKFRYHVLPEVAFLPLNSLLRVRMWLSGGLTERLSDRA